MTDLEMTKLCAEAMGIDVAAGKLAHGGETYLWIKDIGQSYSPLESAEQCFDLIEKFRLLVDGGNAQWCVHGDVIGSGCINDNLNRAIVECVARMQSGTHSGGGR